MSQTQEWYYIENGKKKGPIAECNIAELIASGMITPYSRVWTQSLKEWIEAEKSDLEYIFQKQNEKPEIQKPINYLATQEQIVIASILGFSSALLSSIFVAHIRDTFVPIAFSVIVGTYLYHIKFLDWKRFAFLSAFITGAYLLANIISFIGFQNKYGLTGPGFISGFLGCFISFIPIFFLKQKPKVETGFYIACIIGLAVYSAFSMTLAGTLQNPNLGFPKKFLPSMIIYAPWQAIFAGALTYLFGKSEYRRA